MGSDDLNKKALSGVIWTFIERISTQATGTIVGIIIARILMPSDYGIIAVVNIFITLCNVLVVTGLGESLIQKKDADELDFSSIFYVNLILAVIMYVGLFFAAPLFSEIYGAEYAQLTPIMRVLAIRLIFSAINSIQRAKVVRELAFKKIFFVSSLANAVSAVIGISMAYHGCGVWALVAQNMTYSGLEMILLFIFAAWYPKWIFSWRRMRSLISYGWKILAGAITSTIVGEAQNFFIGLKYSPADLAFYSKGKTYPGLLSNNLTNSISITLYPVLAKVQDDRERGRQFLKTSISSALFVVAPGLVGFSVVAVPFVKLFLTAKWLPCVPYLQLMCYVCILRPVIRMNWQGLCARGKSGVYLSLSTVSQITYLLLLLFALKHGVYAIAVSFLIATCVEYLISTIMTSRYYKYGILLQIYDNLKTILSVTAMGTVVFFTGKIVVRYSPAIVLVIQITIGTLFFTFLSVALKNPTFENLIIQIRNLFLSKVKS